VVIDSSALLAILFDEPERERFIRLIDRDPKRLLSAVSWLEASLVVLGRKREAGLADLDRFLDRAAIERVPVDLEQAHLARAAFVHFGKGPHAAGLNLGDCFSYGLTKATGEPLLFKGSDFAATDVSRVA
jgi:ribonuclease VapC